MHPISLVARAACALVLACSACLPARAATVDVPAPDMHPQVATTLKVTPLTNGNLLIHDAAAFDGRGAVRLARPDGSIVSTLRGRHPMGTFSQWSSDALGVEVHALPNGHALVVSQWTTPAGYVGAITWVDGEHGLEGTADETNSLVGVLTSEGNAGAYESGSLRAATLHPLPDGGVLVAAQYWNRGAGAVFRMHGDRPSVGLLDDSRVLAGARPGDRFGERVVDLGGGAFAIEATFRLPAGAIRHGAILVDAGAMATGRVGEDRIAWGPQDATDGLRLSMIPLGSGAVALSYGSSRVGLRWCHVSQPCTGPMTDGNAILGTSWSWAFEVAGVLANGDYIVANYGLNNGAARSAGGVRLCRAGAPCTGPITEANALVGTRDFDRVGERVLMLSNGHAIVVSANWSGADRPKGGAFTWFDGGGSTVGAVSEANSLVGPAYSGIGGLSSSPSLPNGGSLGGSIVELPDGDVLIASPIWTDDPAVLGKGAITRFSGDGPVTGEVGPANSIVGTRGDMLLGSGGFRLTADGHIIIVSPVARAADDGTERVGAITWWHRDAPTTGTIGPHNSLVGSSPGDFIGYGGVRPIGDGRVMVISPDWRNGTQRKAGAITIMPDDRPWSAVVSAGNSVVGDQAFDRVGGSGFGLWRRVGEGYEEVAPDDLRPVRNGFAIVSSGYWRTDYSSTYDIHSIGAITAFLPGATPTGVLSESNSLVGETYGISPSALWFQPVGERVRLHWHAFAERVGGVVDVPMGELRGRFLTLSGDGVEGRSNLSSLGFSAERRGFEDDGSVSMRHEAGGPFATSSASVFRPDRPIPGLLPRNTVVATTPGQQVSLAWMPASSTLAVVRPADGLVSLLRDNAVPVLGEDGAITGGPGVGDAFTLAPPSASDEDGDALVLAYQWRRGDAPIDGATALTYVATVDDAGARLSVEVIARDAQDRAVRIVAGPRVASDANRAPVFAREPVIGGRPRVAGRLRAYHLEATDPDGDPVVVRLQWRRDGVAIPGATAASYVVGFADADAVIDLVVEASDGLAATVAETNALPIDETSPVVEDDRFEARSGFPIQVPAPGIFANDANVVLPTVAQTSGNGMLGLDAQGGINYMSSFDFVGDDVWMYRACTPDFIHCGYAEIVISVRPNEPTAPPPGTQVLVAERDYAALEVDLPLAAPVDDAIYEVVDLAQRWTTPLPARAEGDAFVIDLPSNPTTRALRWRVLLRAEGSGALRVQGEAGAARCTGALSDGVSTCGLEVTVPPRALSTRVRARVAEGQGVVLHQVQALDPVADTLGGIVAHGPRVATDEARVRLVADLPGGFMPLGDGLGQPFTFTVVARDKRDGTELGRWPLWLHRGLALPTARPLSDRREVRLLVSDRFVAPTAGRNGMSRFLVNNRDASRVVLEAPEGVVAMLQHRPLQPGAGSQAVPLFGAWSTENDLPSPPIPFVRGSDGLLRVSLPSFNTDLFAIDLSLAPGMGGTHEVRAWLELAAPVQFYGDQAPAAGQYFNPRRDGHGIFLEYGGSEAVAWWYAYDEDGRPAWYYAQAPRPEPRKPLRMKAYRATWTAAGGVHLVEVGELLLTRVGIGVNDLRLVAQYRLDGYTGEEELTRLGAGGCLAIGPSAQPIDAGGGWFAPALDGYGFSVQWERATGDEINVGFLYDGEGLPRWAIGQAPGTGAVTSSVPLVQYRGFPIAGDPVPLASQGIVGSLSRTIGVLPQDGRPGLSHAAVSVDWADGVPGGFAADQPMARLTDRKACFGGP